jgi:hypothetical protein
MKTPGLIIALLIGLSSSAQISVIESKEEKNLFYADVINRLKRSDSTLTLTDLEKAASIYPLNGALWYRLADARFRNGQYDEAIVAYKNTLALGANEPTKLKPTVHFKVARCFARKQAYDSSMYYVQSSMKEGYFFPASFRSLTEFTPLHNLPAWKALFPSVTTANTSRNEGWKHDIAVLVQEAQRLHYNAFADFSKEEQQKWKAEIQEKIPRMNDSEIKVAILAYLKRLGGGHTGLPRMFRYFKTLPVELALFEDGVFIRTAAEANAGLIGAQVLDIEGIQIDKLAKALRPLMPEDNPNHIKMLTPDFLIMPELLHGLNLIPNDSVVILTIKHGDKKERKVRLTASKVRPRMLSLQQAYEVPQPLYLQHPDSLYWIASIPKLKALYFQCNLIANKSNESLQAFALRLQTALEQPEVKRLIVDLRHNGGGNSFLYMPLLNVILRNEKINQPERLFVITSRNTFSAAVNLVTDLEKFAHPIIVGEATGSSPNNIGENTSITLPYSKLIPSVSSMNWQYSWPSDARIWITPQLPAPLYSKDFFKAVDPSLAIIEKYLGNTN